MKKKFVFALVLVMVVGAIACAAYCLSGKTEYERVALNDSFETSFEMDKAFRESFAKETLEEGALNLESDDISVTVELYPNLYVSFSAKNTAERILESWQSEAKGARKYTNAEMKEIKGHSFECYNVKGNFEKTKDDKKVSYRETEYTCYDGYFRLRICSVYPEAKHKKVEKALEHIVDTLEYGEKAHADAAAKDYENEYFKIHILDGYINGYSEGDDSHFDVYTYNSNYENCFLNRLSVYKSKSAPSDLRTVAYEAYTKQLEHDKEAKLTETELLGRKAYHITATREIDIAKETLDTENYYIVQNGSIYEVKLSAVASNPQIMKDLYVMLDTLVIK